MQLIRAATTAASVALLSLPPQAQAQGNTANNLTLRFFSGEQRSCDFSASQDALTFTTSSIPVTSHCFDVADLFGGNSTSGFVNQTQNLAQNAVTDGNAGIAWQLLNKESYSRDANYSSILYRQNVPSSGNDDLKPGVTSKDRRVTVYGGKGCSELKEGSPDLVPWYGFSCLTDNQGSCGTTSYNIASFSVQHGDQADGGKCWTFAERGQPNAAAKVSMGAMAAFVSLGTAVWLAL